MSSLPPGNLLAQESSPYLRQHRGNPVHWRPWSRAALDEARTLQKPILLSIGYAACHWCHVMAHESFENDEAAAVMNRLFVNIKVDREERPDIDQIHMAALTAMGEQGGWPLTMFLTPDGKPFWGGTYFPLEPRYGRPGFIQVLEAVSRTWSEKGESLIKSADALTQHVTQRLAPAANPQGLDARTLPALASSIFDALDTKFGGLRGAPKFPNAPFMTVLWQNWYQNRNDTQRDAAIASLRTMLSGGIYDHLGGGLCRYATDETWLVPHFEKMLYDNAQLITQACAAYAASGDELFRLRIEETIAFLAREMLVSGGGFASSLDADSEGEEGRFYLWTKEEIEDVLGRQDSAILLSSYALASPPGWEGAPIFHRLGSPSHGAADTDPAIQSMKELLLAARSRRMRPGRDDKVLVDWNGMAIAAIASAGRQFGRDDWIDLAASAFRFVTESEVKGRLPHSILGKDRLLPCMASDYAAMINACVALFEATGDQTYTERAWNWLESLDNWHSDEEKSGHYLTASDATDVPIRVRGDSDDAVPSSTAQILEAMLRLSMLTSDSALYDRAVHAAEAAIGRVAGQNYGQAGIVAAAELIRAPKKLVIVGQKDGTLVSVANRNPDITRTDIVVESGSDAGAVTLANGTTIDASRPAAYLCIGQSCLPPVTTPQELGLLLTGGS